jgi:hypothetical protein
MRRIENIYIVTFFISAIGRFHVPWFSVPFPLMFISSLLIKKHTLRPGMKSSGLSDGELSLRLVRAPPFPEEVHAIL